MLVVASIASLVAMLVMYTPGQDPSRVYFGTGTRALELLLGALLALVLAHPAGFVLRIPRWAWEITGFVAAAVVLVLWVCTKQSDSWLYQGGLAGYALMSCLVIVAAIRKGPIRSLLSFSWLRWVGAVSYGAYLFHWPIYLWLTAARTQLSPWPLFGLRVSVTLGAAALSAKFLEMPIRRRRFPVRLRPSLLSGATVCAIVIALLAVTSNPEPSLISLATPISPVLPPTTSGTAARHPTPGRSAGWPPRRCHRPCRSRRGRRRACSSSVTPRH